MVHSTCAIIKLSIDGSFIHCACIVLVFFAEVQLSIPLCTFLLIIFCPYLFTCVFSFRHCSQSTVCIACRYRFAGFFFPSSSSFIASLNRPILPKKKEIRLHCVDDVEVNQQNKYISMCLSRYAARFVFGYLFVEEEAIIFNFDTSFDRLALCAHVCVCGCVCDFVAAHINSSIRVAISMRYHSKVIKYKWMNQL